MSNGRHGANTITIADKEYLLAGGGKTHLVGESPDSTSGQPALPRWRFEEVEPWHASYDVDRLQEPRWSHKTLCGRDWQGMEPWDGPRIEAWSKPVHAPSCRSCLRIASRNLASRPPDERIPLVASLAIQEVSELSSSGIDGVPGDQAEALRAELRNELRRLGLRGRTHLHGNTVHVVSDDAWDALPQNQRDALRQEAAGVVVGSMAVDTPLSQRLGIHWDTWRTS